MTNVSAIRQAVIDAIPFRTSNYGESPDPRSVYVPPAHVKALRLESNVVVGSRGVGKSFWTAALNTPSLRAMLGVSVRDLEHTEVIHVGFAGTEDIDAYPTPEVFADLIADGFTPYEIWRAVVVRWLASVSEDNIPTGTWATTTAWVKSNPEPLARIVQKANNLLLSRNEKGLILFDALDRTSNDWHIMDTIVRDLLKAALWMKSCSQIHAKVFLREDQFSRTVTDFPDASKLLATKAELTWQPHDLHGLLWQLLCNAPEEQGELLRSIYKDVLGYTPSQNNGIWSLTDEARRDSPHQRVLFEALAGRWMGKDRRRGVPYIWTVSHLADGKGRASPRSFLAAVREAAEDSRDKYPDHPRALHYESIKRGVQKASSIRIDELAEDYPWATLLLGALQGLTVPCEFNAITDRWDQRFPTGLETASFARLPPQHAERGWSGILEDLERLGLLEKMKDSRINMPDLYRVGFGLGRRGGVKPMSRT